MWATEGALLHSDTVFTQHGTKDRNGAFLSAD
jgi:hypothetical protein